VTRKTGIYAFIRSLLLRLRNVSEKKIIGKSRTHPVYSVLFFWKSCCLWDDVEKRGIAGQATDDYSMVHAHCMLDN